MNKVSELIVDAYGCRADLSDETALLALSRDAVLSVGARIAREASHRFQPHGLTLCLILQESHFVMSTWPEHGLAIVNIFLCNAAMDTRAVWGRVEAVLRPEKVVFHDVAHRIERLKKAA